ncbi:MAG: proline racemase family protein [Rhodospirillales bacterium]|nr:proline racemase family protein [Rhodospirillales bacterium]
MRWKKTLQLVDVHCEGEVGKVVTAGVIDIPGDTMAAKLAYLNAPGPGTELRKFLIFEPRGCVQASVNILTPPTHPDADAGFIVLQPDQAHAMSGSNSICVVTALLETGTIEMVEPETVVTLDTAAGLVRATARCQGGRCQQVSLNMVPSFIESLDQVISTEEWGDVSIDLAFGGVFYAIVDVQQLGLTITPDNARGLVEAGMILKAACNRDFPVVHPKTPEINGIAYVMFRDRSQPDFVRTCTTMSPGRVDRSPCGTGSSANLATQFARGEIAVGDKTKTISIIGSEFEVSLLGTDKLGEKVVVLPRVTGRGWIYGFQQIGLDPTDPFPEGFSLSDTWGPALAELED